MYVYIAHTCTCVRNEIQFEEAPELQPKARTQYIKQFPSKLRYIPKEICLVKFKTGPLNNSSPLLVIPNDFILIPWQPASLSGGHVAVI